MSTAATSPSTATGTTSVSGELNNNSGSNDSPPPTTNQPTTALSPASPTNEEVEDDSVMSSNPLEFSKTLSSDLSAEQSLVLLREAWGTEPLFSELFEEKDLASCAAILSVLTFSPGEQIITAGEEATFAALLLEGDVLATISPTVIVPLPRSSWVGEMAYFERGPRSADITAKTAATLAVLSYDDLDRLNNDGQGDLCHKFTMLLAMHSIKKLRKMTNLPQNASTAPAATPAVVAAPAASATPAAEETKPAESAATVAAGAPAAASTTATAVPTRPAKSEGKKETLFVERLKKQSERLAEAEAKQKQDMAHMANLVKKRETEAQHAHATVKHKLTKLENEVKECQTKIADLTKKWNNEKKRAKEAQEMAVRIDKEKMELHATILEREKSLAGEKTRVKMLENTREKFEQAFEKNMKVKEEENLNLNIQISQLKHSAGQSNILVENMNQEKQGLIIEKERLEADVTGLHTKIQTMDNEKGFADFRIKALQEKAEQFELECAGWRRKSADYLENYEKLLNKYRIDLVDLQKEKNKISIAHRTYHKLIRMLALKTYVRNFLFRRYLFNIHLRISEMVVARWEERMENQRVLNGGMYPNSSSADAKITSTAQVTSRDAGDMNSLYQQLANASAKHQKLLPSAAFTANNWRHSPTSQHDSSHHHHLSSPGSNNINANAGGSGPVSPALMPQGAGGVGSPGVSYIGGALLAPYNLADSYSSQVDPSNPASELSVFAYTSPSETQHVPHMQLRIEKKKYLLALKNKRNPPCSIMALLQSIEEELVELKTPLEEMNHTIVDLRTTLDSFFKRNIQLTSKCLHTKKALEVAQSNYETLKASIRARHMQESSANPFSQHLLLDSVGSRKEANASGVSSSGAYSARSATGKTYGINSSGSGGDEKEDYVLARAATPSSGRILTHTGLPSDPTPAASSFKKKDGSIDWSALEHEKSSGYGVTAPRVRRESKLVHVPPGSTLKMAPTPSAASARRPSASLNAGAVLTPRPPTAPSSIPTISAALASPAANSGSVPFALPKVP